MLADRFPRASAMGRVLRWPLRLVPTQQPRTVVSGAGAGLVWYPASGPHGIWLGIYERRVLRTFERELRDRSVVWDVGAHAGLYSLVAARKGATVFAFEPLPANVQWIARHLEANAQTHSVSVLPFALASRSGQARFEPDVTRMSGRLTVTGTTFVQIWAADDLHLPPPPTF
jgi:hypothetical protein